MYKYKWNPARLALLMEESNVTVKSMCDAMGITYKSINDYLHGRARPNLQNLIKMADFFAVPLDYLMGRCSEKDIQAVVENFRPNFESLQHASYEMYLTIKAKYGIFYAPADGYLSPWPYNLVENIFQEPCQEVLTEDQIEGLNMALASLYGNEKDILCMLYKESKTLDQVGCLYGVGRERIRQIAAKAVRKLRHPSRSNMIKMGCTLYQKNSYITKLQLQLDCAERAVLLAQQDWIDSHPDESLDVPLEHLGLSVRIYNALKRAGVNTLSNVIDLLNKETALCGIRNLGMKSAMELCETVNALTGMQFKVLNSNYSVHGFRFVTRPQEKQAI